MSARPESTRLLASQADRWLTAEPPNIVRKKHIAPSGDPHDYISIPPYSWPNPAKPNGLPWVNRDGEVNPAFYEYDNQTLETFCLAVNQLILHAYASGSAAHARRGGKFLRCWFLDKATRMNPHLRYAQGIPGGSEGRSIGIIDSTSLIFLFDAVTHLDFNEEWTPKDLADLKGWVSQYLDWLMESAPGKQEGKAANNHGTWYDAQVAAYAYFCGKPELARQEVVTHARQRISSQIEPDGRQPRELARTLSLTYCSYNTLAFACLAQISKNLGSDLWGWKTPDGRGLLSALKWLVPYYSRERSWTHKQIRAFDFTASALLLNLAWQGTGDAQFEKLSRKAAEQPWQRISFSKAGIAARKNPGR